MVWSNNAVCVIITLCKKSYGLSQQWPQHA